MKKQFVTLMTLLGISAALVGCNSTEQKPTTDIVMETPVNEETSENLPETDTSTEKEEIPSESTESTEAGKETTNESEVVAEKENSEKTPEQVESKPVEVTKPSTTNKPSAGTTNTSKPNTNNTPSKPSNDSKPTNNKKPATSTKPETTPSTKPEVAPTPTPSPTPEVKPEATPESTPETTSLSSNEIFSKITEGIEFAKQVDVDATLLNDLYGIDVTLLESYSVKMPMMSFSISEIGVFKVKDANNINHVVEGINKRANNVGQMLYPSLQETFDSRVITTKGNYILFAMDESASVIEANFNNLIK